MPPLRRHPFLLVPLLTLLIFSPVLTHAFLYWDDHRMLFQNPHLNPPTLPSLLRFWTHEYYGLYTPLSYSAQWFLAHLPRTADNQLHPALYHAASLLAHAATATLTYALLRKLAYPALPATLGALAFSLHPLQSEPVNWASSFYTVFSGALGVAALTLFLHHRNLRAAGDTRSPLYATLATATYLLALFAKPSLVTLPLLAFVLDYFARPTPPRPLRSYSLLILWFLLAIPIGLITMSVQEGQYKLPVPLYERPLIAADSAAFYLLKTLFPYPLAIDYGRSPHHLRATGQYWFTWLLPAALLALCLVHQLRIGRSRQPHTPDHPPFPSLAIALTFLLGALPFLGLLTFGFQRISTVADRYAYLSLLAVALAVAHLARRYPRALPAILLLLLTYAGLTLADSRRWADTRTLMTHTLAANPTSSVAHNVLAHLATEQGEADQAAFHYTQTLRHHPHDGFAHYNLGNRALAQSDLQAAIDHYQSAMTERHTDPQLWSNLAIAQARAGDPARAEQSFRRAISLDPTWPAPHANLGALLASQGRLDEARRAYESALYLDPHFPTALNGLKKLDFITP